MSKITWIIVSISLFTSCAVHKGTISMLPVDKGYIYKDIAIGVSQCQKVFGIGGTSQDAMVYEAKKELYKNFPLSGNEAYSNFTLDFKKTSYLFFSKTKVTMTADIVGAPGKTDTSLYTQSFRNAIGFTSNRREDLFCVGDTVFYDSHKQAVIVSFPATDRVKLNLGKVKKKLVTRNISVYSIYTSSKNYKNLTIGGSYTYKDKINGEEYTFIGKIIAIGKKSVMVQKEKSNEILIQDY